MRLIHTLLFMLRKDNYDNDLKLAGYCLKSLEKSTYKDVVVYNQGLWSNDELKEYLSQFDMNFIIIGDGTNTGTTVGRQRCFEYIFKNYPETEMVTELHLDMVFTYNWEDPLVDYLDSHEDEPLIGCGVVDENGEMLYLGAKAPVPPKDTSDMDDYLKALCCNTLADGYTNPCIHKTKVLEKAGGYDADFLTGKHAFEDDSMLLGYFYYYGFAAKWQPKVLYKSVVYHQVAGQRITEGDEVMVNYNGLVRQYGAMGLKHLSEMKRTPWQGMFFAGKHMEVRKQR